MIIFNNEYLERIINKLDALLEAVSPQDTVKPEIINKALTNDELRKEIRGLKTEVREGASELQMQISAICDHLGVIMHHGNCYMICKDAKKEAQ